MYIYIYIYIYVYVYNINNGNTIYKMACNVNVVMLCTRIRYETNESWSGITDMGGGGDNGMLYYLVLHRCDRYQGRVALISCPRVTRISHT